MNRGQSSYNLNLIVIFIFLLIQGVSSFGITLYMKEMVFITDQVFLGELVTIKGAPYFLAEQIREYPLPLSPKEIHLLPSRYIRDLISRFTGQSVVISGVKTALIPHTLSHNPGSGYMREFITFLMSELCKKENRVEIEIRSIPFSLSKNSHHEYVFRLNKKKNYMDYVLGEITVVALSNENIPAEDREWVLNVHQHIPVVKAKNSLKRNEDLTWGNLFIAEQRLNPFMGQVLLPHDRISGYKTVKDLYSGETLLRSHIRKSLKVHSGEQVFITFQKGSIRLTMTGRAGDSGSIGDKIKVRPSQSTEWIVGRVTGAREVHIEL